MASGGGRGGVVHLGHVGKCCRAWRTVWGFGQQPPTHFINLPAWKIQHNSVCAGYFFIDSIFIQ